MSKAKDMYLKVMGNIDSSSMTGESIENYVEELESNKKELIEFARDNLKSICINCSNNVIKNCLCEMKQYNMKILKKYEAE